MSDAPPTRFRLLTVPEILARHEPAYVVRGILPAASRTMLFGASGAGKSFVALDLALHIAAGATDWFGHAVVPGPVCYVVAEGAHAFHTRVAAWLRAQQRQDVAAIRFVYDAVQLLDLADTAALVQAIRAELPTPSLVVFDTYHACTPGSEENSAKDAGLTMNSLALLQRDTGAAALLLHHPQKHGEMERGSSALKAAMDVVLKLTADEDGTLTLRSTKVKDGPPLERVTLRLVGFDGSAIVCEPDGSQEPAALSSNEQRALEALASIALEDGVTVSEWLETSGLTKPTFMRLRKRLVETGSVTKTRNRYRVTQQTDSPDRSQVSMWSHGGLSETPGTLGITTFPSLEEGKGETKPDTKPETKTQHRYCRLHPACFLEVSPLTQAPACWSCTPGLFPGRARTVPGGHVFETPAGSEAP